MERNWHILRDEQEISILKQYSEHSRLFSLVFATLMYSPLITFIFHQFLPNILDILLPLNESRPHKIPVLFEYFVDEEKYFYLLIIHVNLMVFMGTTAIIASETMTTLIMYHICAFLKIISYRLQFVFDQNFHSRSASPATQCTANEKLIDVIKAHRNVIEFGNTCFNSQSTAYFLLLSLGIISISLCLYRLTTCMKLKCTEDVLLKILPYVIASLTFLLKYVSICFKVEMIVYDFEQMERNWRTLRDEQEITILKQYSEHSRLFSLVFATLMYAPLIAVIFYQFLPDILDILLPLNETRPHKMPVLFEYFLDQEKYFYLLILHANLMVFMGTTAIIASETMTTLIMYHICAFFKIISYRLQFVFDQNFHSDSVSPVTQCTANEKLIDVIKAHKDVIEFGTEFIKSQSTGYFLLLSLGIISISLCLYRLHHALSLMDDMPELFNAAFLLVANLIYLFLTNFLGQTVMDHSSKIFTDIYRLNNTYRHDTASQYPDHSRQCVTDESVIGVIKAHKNALQFANAFLRNFPTAYLSLHSLAVVSITLCLHRFQQAVLLMEDIPEFINAVCHVTANFIYLFFVNFLGQSVMDHSSSVFVDIYCAPWYTASLPAQHTLLFAMQRSIEGWAHSIAGVFVLNFESFSMTMRMAMSYFMAIRSIQR
ncbi:hypothetical protein KM043_002521 [Ampulex compressa]|nr:hypothetical protein KM043_002521 [Ampulex compressa]